MKPPDSPDDAIIRQQVEYYRARAAEYDEWFLRQGRYDRGPEQRADWEREVAYVRAALDEILPAGAVLELASGTGLWTAQIAPRATRLIAVDASPEAIAINRARVQSPGVEYVHADLFSWTPPAGAFDVVFFSFWLSHVPPARFDAFWRMVREALRPGGLAFFVDNLRAQASTARDHAPLDDSGIARRRLNDGREFDIVKVFYEPAALELRLASLGWTGWVRSSGRYFLYGAMK